MAKAGKADKSKISKLKPIPKSKSVVREVVTKKQAIQSSREFGKKIAAAAAFILVVAYVYSFLSAPQIPPTETPPICKNLCGDGICQEFVCTGSGCPCPETNNTCPQDCKAKGQSDYEQAQAIAEDYVRTLYCFNNYNSSNLQLLNLTKISDENGGTYEAYYQFDINSELMPGVSAMRPHLLISNNFVSSAQVSRIYSSGEGFCGYSTNGWCETDGDCFASGCSGQVCQSKSDESMATTCEWRDCYDAEKYKLSCKCLNHQCVWF